MLGMQADQMFIIAEHCRTLRGLVYKISIPDDFQKSALAIT